MQMVVQVLKDNVSILHTMLNAAHNHFPILAVLEQLLGVALQKRKNFTSLHMFVQPLGLSRYRYRPLSD